MQNRKEKQIMPFKTTVNWLFRGLFIKKKDWHRCEYYEIFKNSFFITSLAAPSEFPTKLAENNCEENHFSVELFPEITLKLFPSLSCDVSKKSSLHVFQFLSFPKHVTGLSRTQSTI